MTILFFIINVNTHSRSRAEFVGYDELFPILVLREYDKGDYKYDISIYKYANIKLTEMQVSRTNNQVLLLVKDGIYVFSDNIDNNSIRFQFRLNGKELISELKLKSEMLPISTQVVLNKESFFILDQDDDSAVILRTKYRSQTDKIDTIVNIKGYCNGMLDATEDYLYYSIDDSKSIAPKGNIYQVNLKNGTTNIIVGNIMAELNTTIVSNLNLICDAILFDGSFHFLLVDYKKRRYAISHSESGTIGDGVFYSYEHNAFVYYQLSSDLKMWRSLPLDSISEWKHFTNPLLKPDAKKEQPTGPKLVPFIKNGTH
jgi:hypothetical protein